MRSLFVRDGREAAVEQGGDRLVYIVVSYRLLLIAPTAPSWSSTRLGISSHSSWLAGRLRPRLHTEVSIGSSASADEVGSAGSSPLAPTICSSVFPPGRR